MDLLLYTMVLLITGVAAGLATGLLGVGGGFIIVPALYFIMESMGIPMDTAIRTAFGTSLAVILPTALNGARSHYRRGFLDLEEAIPIGVLGFLGSMAGAYTAGIFSAEVLKSFFGALLLFIALQMIFSGKIDGGRELRGAALPLGFLAGLLSGLLGIGGGVVLVPLLVMVAGFDVLEAVGTSSLVIALTAAGGTASYIYSGLGRAPLPFSAGYVNILQFMVIVFMSVPFSWIGASLAHSVDVRYIRYLFIIMLLLTGLRMIF